MRRGLFVCLLAVPAAADTVFLYNGTAIDGVIRARHETTIELQIGRVGRIFVDLDVIESIEKNDRDGGAQSSALSLERRREEVGDIGKLSRGKPSAEGSATAAKGGPASGATAGATGREKRYLKKSDVEPELRKKIEQAVAELTRQKRTSRVRAERDLVDFGEPVVPFLKEAADHENHLVRIAVCRILKKVGNEAAIPLCIDRLEDENQFVRQGAADALKELTGRSFGFFPNGAAKARKEAVAAWRAWYEGQKAGDAEESARDEDRAKGRDAGNEETGEKAAPASVQVAPRARAAKADRASKKAEEAEPDAVEGADEAAPEPDGDEDEGASEAEAPKSEAANEEEESAPAASRAVAPKPAATSADTPAAGSLLPAAKRTQAKAGLGERTPSGPDEDAER